MPRLINRNPSYRLHKPSGQAVVTLNGQDVYLGPYGSAESRREYDRLLAEWLARGRQLPGPDANRRIADVIKGYWDHAKAYYGIDRGRAELQSIKLALALLRRTYGTLPAREFGPLALQVVRERMVKTGWSRRYINAQIGRLKRCFKWACSRELISPSVFHGLQAVDGLRQGKSEARECEPVKPVPEEWVEATIPHVSRPVASMIRLQLASGMRPGEALSHLLLLRRRPPGQVSDFPHEPRTLPLPNSPFRHSSLGHSGFFRHSCFVIRAFTNTFPHLIPPSADTPPSTPPPHAALRASHNHPHPTWPARSSPTPAWHAHQ